MRSGNSSTQPNNNPNTMSDEKETGGGTQVSTNVYIKDGKLIKETIHVSGPPPESDEVKKLRLEQEAKEREEQRKAKQVREEREAKEQETLRKREDDERAANRAHIEKMVTETESRWWRYLVAVLLGAAIVWFSWYLFVCSDCMQGRVGDPYQNDEGFQLPDAPEPEEVGETAQAEESSSDDNDAEDDSEDEETAEVDQSYGVYTPGDPKLMLRLVAHFSGPEQKNFRKFDHFGRRDSLDGENKFVLLAAQLATLISSNRKVVKMGDNWKVVEATYHESSILEDASSQAWKIGQRALYDTPYQNAESFEYWVNAAVEDVPSSSSTDFSEAVRACIENFHEILQERNVPEINDIKFKFAGLKTSKPKTKKKTVSITNPCNRWKTEWYTSLGYVSPVKSSFTITGELCEWRSNNKRYHKGQDLDTPSGVSVVSCSPKKGKVVEVGYNSGLGNFVKVDHGDVIITYAHLREGSSRRVGDRVKQRDLLGKVGSTGHSTGSHLHIEFEPKKKDFKIPIFGKKSTKT